MTASKALLDKYTAAWYRGDLQSKLNWLGRKTVKNPNDLLVTQEIIWETRPEAIVEVGIFHGGTTRYYAHLFDLIEAEEPTDTPGIVVGVDLYHDPEFDYPNHPRIEFLLGASSTDPAVVEQVAKRVHNRRTMVILDSDHSCDHVLQELRLYHKFVSTGCYLIVEDTNEIGMRIMGQNTPGPWPAVKAWDPKRHGFEIDREREKFMLTFHPGGYLKKVRHIAK